MKKSLLATKDGRCVGIALDTIENRLELSGFGYDVATVSIDFAGRMYGQPCADFEQMQSEVKDLRVQVAEKSAKIFELDIPVGATHWHKEKRIWLDFDGEDFREFQGGFNGLDKNGRDWRPRFYVRDLSEVMPTHYFEVQAIERLQAENAMLRTAAIADAARIAELESELAAADLRECKNLALYSKAEATIGAGLIDIGQPEKVEQRLSGFMQNTETPWHLYDDAQKFYDLYKMGFPLTVAEHLENVKKLNAVFDADMLREEQSHD
jgi:hypothetical protein